MNQIQSELVESRDVGWSTVMRDVLEFQFKLVVDGIKDLTLAQVALGAALLDFFRRDGSPGRRFYGIVRLSDRFDRWLDLHAAAERAPVDTPDLLPVSSHSVDDVLGGLEISARRVANASTRLSRRRAFRSA
ncbi:MAG: hypothetical protein E4H28_03555 [Gemmatimonadales bacterium]|nr:MAG: hypothetical protein E4H28_03555 [Gemmatimonadales bacterium]